MAAGGKRDNDLIWRIVIVDAVGFYIDLRLKLHIRFVDRLIFAEVTFVCKKADCDIRIRSRGQGKCLCILCYIKHKILRCGTITVYTVVKKRGERKCGICTGIFYFISDCDRIFSMLESKCLCYLNATGFVGKVNQSVVGKAGQILLTLFIVRASIGSFPLSGSQIVSIRTLTNTFIHLGKDNIAFYRRMQAGDQIAVVLSGVRTDD